MAAFWPFQYHRAFAYYYNFSLAKDSSVPAIWYISLTDYVEIAVLRILPVFHESLNDVALLYNLMGDKGFGALVSLPSFVLRAFDDIGFLDIICSCSLDPVALLAAYCRSTKVAGAWVERGQRCYLYQFSAGKYMTPANGV